MILYSGESCEYNYLYLASNRMIVSVSRMPFRSFPHLVIGDVPLFSSHGCHDSGQRTADGITNVY